MNELLAAIQQLVGCAWGRSVWTDDDPARCPERAASIAVVHDGVDEVQLRLCPKHKSRLVEETDPHEEEEAR